MLGMGSIPSLSIWVRASIIMWRLKFLLDDHKGKIMKLHRLLGH
jgi:hypothetical protein